MGSFVDPGVDVGSAAAEAMAQGGIGPLAARGLLCVALFESF